MNHFICLTEKQTSMNTSIKTNHVRVLVWVLTQPENHDTKAKQVKETWGKRADMLLFMSDKNDASLPAIGLNTSRGREHLSEKSMRAFQHVYDHHYEDADWFMKADDDTYVIVENLRRMLRDYDPSLPVYFGHHFNMYGHNGYMSGGSGYVLSKEALRRFGTRDVYTCPNVYNDEDVDVGRCLSTLGVRIGDSNDARNRSRFHCFPITDHIFGRYPKWYFKIDKFHGRKVSFHRSIMHVYLK